MQQETYHQLLEALSDVLAGRRSSAKQAAIAELLPAEKT